MKKTLDATDIDKCMIVDWKRFYSNFMVLEIFFSGNVSENKIND